MSARVRSGLRLQPQQEETTERSRRNPLGKGKKASSSPGEFEPATHAQRHLDVTATGSSRAASIPPQPRWSFSFSRKKLKPPVLLGLQQALVDDIDRNVVSFIDTPMYYSMSNFAKQPRPTGVRVQDWLGTLAWHGMARTKAGWVKDPKDDKLKNNQEWQHFLRLPSAMVLAEAAVGPSKMVKGVQFFQGIPEPIMFIKCEDCAMICPEDGPCECTGAVRGEFDARALAQGYFDAYDEYHLKAGDTDDEDSDLDTEAFSEYDTELVTREDSAEAMVEESTKPTMFMKCEDCAMICPLDGPCECTGAAQGEYDMMAFAQGYFDADDEYHLKSGTPYARCERCGSEFYTHMEFLERPCECMNESADSSDRQIIQMLSLGRVDPMDTDSSSSNSHRRRENLD